MPKYLFEARYSSEGAGGLAREGGVGRRAAARKHLEELGGKLGSRCISHSGKWTVSSSLTSSPNNASAAAFSLAGNESGAMASRTIVLMVPEELDDATVKKAFFSRSGSVSARSPFPRLFPRAPGHDLLPPRQHFSTERRGRSDSRDPGRR